MACYNPKGYCDDYMCVMDKCVWEGVEGAKKVEDMRCYNPVAACDGSGCFDTDPPKCVWEGIVKT